MVLLGPPGTGKTHLAVALVVQAAKHGHRSMFDTAIGWVTQLQDAANPLLKLVASRCEHASLIMMSHLSFKPCCEVSGDPTVASEMIDRIVQHADIISLRGASHQLQSHQPPPGTA